MTSPALRKFQFIKLHVGEAFPFPTLLVVIPRVVGVGRIIMATHHHDAGVVVEERERRRDFLGQQRQSHGWQWLWWWCRSKEKDLSYSTIVKSRDWLSIIYFYTTRKYLYLDPLLENLAFFCYTFAPDFETKKESSLTLLRDGLKMLKGATWY